MWGLTCSSNCGVKQLDSRMSAVTALPAFCFCFGVQFTKAFLEPNRGLLLLVVALWEETAVSEDAGEDTERGTPGNTNTSAWAGVVGVFDKTT